jgi:tRNA uridine 5-carboxymethylaminomethyl modification enzyme
MIDDLVTRGIGGEPYRMFTSRAEYRLLLREDNADRRLSLIGERLGLLNRAASDRMRAKTANVSRETQRLAQALVSASDETNKLLTDVGSSPISHSTRALELLRRPEISYESAIRMARLELALTIDEAAELEIDIKYEGYVKRQGEVVDRFQRLEQTLIPDWLDFQLVPGLSTEVRERLSQTRPRSLGQASRMPGITPAAVSLLAIHLKGRGHAARPS